MSISASEKNALPQSSGWQLHPDAHGYAIWHYHCKLASRVNAIVHVPELTVIPFILVKVSCKKCGKRSPPFRISSNWNTTCPKCKSDNITFTTDVMYQVVYQDGEPEDDTEAEFSYADFENHEEFVKFIVFLNQEREKAGNPLIEPFPIRY